MLNFDIITSTSEQQTWKHIDNWIKPLHYDIISPTKGGDDMEDEEMTGKEILNLIYKLRSEGKTDTEIIEFIIYLETHDPSKKQ